MLGKGGYVGVGDVVSPGSFSFCFGFWEDHVLGLLRRGGGYGTRMGLRRAQKVRGGCGWEMGMRWCVCLEGLVVKLFNELDDNMLVKSSKLTRQISSRRGL